MRQLNLKNEGQRKKVKEQQGDKQTDKQTKVTHPKEITEEGRSW